MATPSTPSFFFSSTSAPSVLSHPRESDESSTDNNLKSAPSTKRARLSEQQQHLVPEQEHSAEEEEEEEPRTLSTSASESASITRSCTEQLSEHPAVALRASKSVAAPHNAHHSCGVVPALNRVSSDSVRVFAPPNVSSNSSSYSSQSSSAFTRLTSSFTATQPLCRSIHEFISLNDLLFHTFGFLRLKELVHFFRADRSLSTCYFAYRFQPQHELRGDSFLRVLTEYEKLYELHLQRHGIEKGILLHRPLLHQHLVCLRFHTLVKVNSVGELEQLSRMPLFGFVRTLRLCHHVDRLRELFIGCLPPNLTALDAQYLEREIRCGVLPPSLLSIDLGHIKHSIGANILPDGLTELRLNRYDHPLRADMLPASLRVLWLELIAYTIPNGLLPSGLEALTIRIKDFSSLDILSVSLRRLSLTVCQDSLPPGSFPSRLTSLDLIHPCEGLTAGYLPAALRELII